MRQVQAFHEAHSQPSNPAILVRPRGKDNDEGGFTVMSFMHPFILPFPGTAH